MMKRATSILLLLCLLMPMVSFAEPLDFSNVVENDGWLTGEIVTGIPAFENDDTILYVDCAAPTVLMDNQWVRLQIELWKPDEKTFAAALRAAGTDVEKGKLSLSTQEEMHRGAVFIHESQLLTSEGQMLPADEDISKTALDNCRLLWDALGIEVAVRTVYDYGQRYTPDAIQRSGGNQQQLQEEYDKAFLATEAKNGRNPADYLYIVGCAMLRGLPVSTMRYPDGDAREPNADVGVNTYFSALATKDGELVNVSLEGIPQEISAASLPGTQPDWRLAFQKLNEQLNAEAGGNPVLCVQSKDQWSEDGSLWYAQRQVLTAIEPVWVGYNRGELVPGWRFTIENRRLMDNAFISRSDYTIDMAELTVRY